MITVLLLFAGAFWESSMDVIGTKHNYEISIWKRIANYFDGKGMHWFGNRYWDCSTAWSNKWKNNDPDQGPRFFGSNTFLVYLMDGWHLAKALWLIHLFLAIVLYKPITDYLIFDFLILISWFGFSHEIFFVLLQPKKNKNNKKI